MPERKQDYIPRDLVQFNTFMQNMLKYVQGKITEWGHIPQNRLDNLTELYSIFESAFKQKQQPQNLLQYEAQCVSVLRTFINQFLRHPPVTNDDRVKMGVPEHDTIRTERFSVGKKPLVF